MMLFVLLPSTVEDMYSADNLSHTNNLSNSSLLYHSNPQPTSMTSKCMGRDKDVLTPISMDSSFVHHYLIFPFNVFLLYPVWAGLSKAWSTGTLSQIAKGNSLEFQSATVLRALLVILDNHLLLTEEI